MNVVSRSVSQIVNDVWIISDIPAAGKTTTSKTLAKRFAKAAVISRDYLGKCVA